MDDAVRSYLEAAPAEHRVLFDRLDALVLRAYPEAETVLSYQMPTYKVGERRLFVAIWKHGLSVYGWRQERALAFAERHPDRVGAKGTIKLRPADLEVMPDDELLELVHAALAQ
jgi:uncharacterized protein YdhG (YjbR/CyaY superfamily)